MVKKQFLGVPYGKDNEGDSCSWNEEGGYWNCKRYKLVDGEKVYDGDEINIALDGNCKPVFVGEIDMLDKNREHYSRLAQQLAKSCTKGYA